MTMLVEDSGYPEDAMPAQGILTPSGIRVWLQEPGILRVSLPAHAVITGEQAEEAATAVRDAAAGALYPMLLELTGVASVSREARDVYFRGASVSSYALLGQSPVDRVLAHFFVGSATRCIPSRYFTVESEALEWLVRLEKEN